MEDIDFDELNLQRLKQAEENKSVSEEPEQLSKIMEEDDEEGSSS